MKERIKEQQQLKSSDVIYFREEREDKNIVGSIAKSRLIK